MKNSVIAIPFFCNNYNKVYVLLVPVFFEMENNAFGEEKTLLLIMMRRYIVNK